MSAMDMVVRRASGALLRLRYVCLSRFGLVWSDEKNREWMREGDALFGVRAWCCDTGERAHIVSEGGEP